LLPKDFHAELPAAFNGRLQLKQRRGKQSGAPDRELSPESRCLGFLSFVVGLFIVHAAIGLALEQRRGLLRTCVPAG
jgi:putative ABC transport system permease protein